MSAQLGALGQPAWLDAWVEESRIAGRPAGMSAARAAMHAAAPAPGGRRRLVALAPAVRRHPWRLTGAGLAAAAAVALVVGWNAPAGSPLHQVRLGREDLALAFARGSSGVELRLQYAEDRLREAQAGAHPADSLAEAGSLIDGARGDLSADRTDPLWTRWVIDEADLQGQRTVLGSSPPPAPTATPASTPGGERRQAASGTTGSAAGKDGPGGGEATGSHDGSPQTARPGGDRSGPLGGGTSSGRDGGGDGGSRTPGPDAGSSSSTRASTATSETSDDGRGAPLGGGSSSSSSSRSTTSDGGRESGSSTH